MRRLLIPIAVVLLSAGRAGGQPQVPQFRTGVELVRLDVRVVGADGRPVEDLRADEIEIVEGGERRPIVLFQHIHEPREPLNDVARRTIAGEVSTNQGAPRGHLYVIVFDQQHIAAGNEQRARRAAERFLQTRIRPGDRAALYALPGPGPQLTFTGNVDTLLAELPKVRGELDRLGLGGIGSMRIFEAYEITRGNQMVLERVAGRLASERAATDVLSAVAGGVLSGGGDQQEFQTLVKEDARTIVARADQHARHVLLALSDLVRALRRIEGRKNIIFVSEGFYADNVTRELEQVASAAAQSYSVIYALEINRRDGTLQDEAPVGGERFDEIQSRTAPLGALASETDGALFQDVSTWTDGAFTRISDASIDYYIVGFQPSSSALRDRNGYRRVSVRTRRDEVRVSARTGYTIGTDDPTPADRRRDINLALAAPFPQQGLPVEYTTYVLRGSKPGLQRVVLSLAARLPLSVSDPRPPHPDPLPASGEREQYSLSPGTGEKARVRGPEADVVFVVRARDGRVVASGTDVMALPTAGDGDRASRRGLYRVQFEVPPGEYFMRVVVREPGGAVGSADRRVLVRPLHSRDLTASDLILSSSAGRLGVRAEAQAGEIVEGMIELYAPTPDLLARADVRVDLAPVGGEHAITTQAARLLPVDALEAGSTRRAVVELPLEGVSPGEYLARATVRLDGKEVLDLARELEVLPGLASAAPAVGVPTEPVAPLQILGGELGRRYLFELGAMTHDPALVSAVDAATRGQWTDVERAMGTSAHEPSTVTHALAGMVAFAGREFERAAEAFDLAFAADRRNALTAFFRGWAWHGAGDARRAISAWRSATFLDPSLVSAHLALADAYLRVASPELALQAIKAGLSALPGSPELQNRLFHLSKSGFGSRDSAPGIP